MSEPMFVSMTDSRSIKEPLPELPAVGGPTVECMIWRTRVYPVFNCDRRQGKATRKNTIAIPRSTLANWERILREYDKMQQEMELYEAHQERG